MEKTSVEEIKLACLELAILNNKSFPDRVLQTAKEYFDWVVSQA